MDNVLLNDFVNIFCIALVVTYICHLIKLPVIVGFLLTGVLAGPYGFKLVYETHQVEVIAEIGIVLLLFTLGLELSLEKLKSMRKPVFLGGGFQVFLSILSIVVLGLIFISMPLNKAIFWGFLVSLSSTAIVIKVLQEQGLISSPAGRISLSILIFQDLIAVPMMLAIPILAGNSGEADSNIQNLFLLFGIDLLKFIALVVIARWSVPKILARVVRTKSREIFLLATLAICLTIALITAKIGLSLALGAFLAGLFIAESEYSLSAMEGILPFRDVFTSLFFISIGMLLNVGFFFSNIFMILLLAAAIMLIKLVVGFFATLLLNYPLRPALIVGFSLSQVGEFSLILANAGLAVGLFGTEEQQTFLAASLLTMAATPFCAMIGPKVADYLATVKWLNKIAKTEQKIISELPSHLSQLEDHLIIIGFGIGGKHLARAAQEVDIPYVIIEMNPDTVKKFSATGIPIYYGDATQRAVLEHININKAKVMAILIPDYIAARRITDLVKNTMSPKTQIIVRTRFLGEIEELKKLGATEVVAEEFEAGIEIFYRVLHRFFIPALLIDSIAEEFRKESYAVLRKLNDPKNLFAVVQAYLSDISTKGVLIKKGSALEGQTLEQSNLRKNYGLTVVAVKRGREHFPMPGADFIFQAEDEVYLMGDAESIEKNRILFVCDEEENN